MLLQVLRRLDRLGVVVPHRNLPERRRPRTEHKCKGRQSTPRRERLNMSMLRKLPKNAFQPGCVPGPGRPPGKRNRLTEIVLQALAADFAEHGAAVIEDVRKTRPHVYLQVYASLMPRQLTVEKLSHLLN